MDIVVERGSAGAPVYQQIADQIRAAVASRSVGEGDKLPTIRALAQQLGVHRDTVAQAYDSLARDGVVETTVGRGTFVACTLLSDAAPFEPRFSSLAERVVAFERSRPRFGSAEDAIQMQSLIPGPELPHTVAFLSRKSYEVGPSAIPAPAFPDTVVFRREPLAPPHKSSP